MTVTPAKAMKAVALRQPAPRELVTVPATKDMTDEIFLRHLELRHPEDLEVTFPPNEDGSDRTIPTRLAFEALHSVRHRLGRPDGTPFDHDHKEPEQRERPQDY